MFIDCVRKLLIYKGEIFDFRSFFFVSLHDVFLLLFFSTCLALLGCCTFPIKDHMETPLKIAGITLDVQLCDSIITVILERYKRQC